jgi:hypothetical protein
VDPPAPKVTEKNFGLSCASCLRVARNFSTPSGVCGGKNSKLKVGANFFCDSIFTRLDDSQGGVMQGGLQGGLQGYRRILGNRIVLQEAGHKRIHDRSAACKPLRIETGTPAPLADTDTHTRLMTFLFGVFEPGRAGEGDKDLTTPFISSRRSKPKINTDTLQACMARSCPGSGSLPAPRSIR